LFGLASGALREARRIAESLVVHERRMRSNLDLTHGLLFADAVSARLAPALGREAAHRIVEEAADVVRDTGEMFQTALAEQSGIPARLRAEVQSAFDLTPAIDAAAAHADRVVKVARTVRREFAAGKGA
jgi:3-carboxy-cis,cis-muconate cycloisomerase